ncbi:hypothetical protein DL765_007791 [Monosporascus sp. GIB2]|nr:hypothetical protein DL765_007791 [Monosporascus sp. GIB2]
MASLQEPDAKDGDPVEMQTNMNVDYVIHYKIPLNKSQAEIEANFTELTQALTKIGLATEVRNCDGSSLLVFVKVASEEYLASQIYRERIQDWLYGVRTTSPEKDVDKAFRDEPIRDAERLRLVYLLITKPNNDGGAGITPKAGRWKHVESIFPLHDHAFNRHWIKQWSSKYYLRAEDLEQIRGKFGESVAFYFAFVQSYFTFLLCHAAFGFSAWLILGQYSWFYAIVNCLWTIFFFEWWKKKEVDLAVEWDVRGVSRIQLPRTQFRWDYEAEDPVTGERVKVYPPLKRFRTQLLQIPFALACFLLLGALYLFCFSIEIFLSEEFTPTIIMTAVQPVLFAILSKLAERLTEAENYRTNQAHHAALVQKQFCIDFLTSYVPLCLTAFLYMPFGNLLVPYLDIFRVAAEKFATDKSVATQSFQINPDRLKKQTIYFTVTAQVVNLVLEGIVPYVKRKAFKEVEKVHTKIIRRDTGGAPLFSDDPEEHAFLERVREEAQLATYDVSIDYREMVVQFGYLSLFSVVWPLTPLSFLINNWVEIRSDAMKIAVSSKRPIPWRADSIGPWLNALGFLSWLGSIVSSAIVFLFNGDKQGPGGEPWNISAWGLLFCILCSEHVYLAFQYIVRYALSQVDSPGPQKERANRFAMRRQLLEESLGPEVIEKPVPPTVEYGESMTRQALMKAASRLADGEAPPAHAFWQRQPGMDETIQYGRKLISRIDPISETAGGSVSLPQISVPAVLEELVEETAVGFLVSGFLDVFLESL